jgi:hypothetical protein
MALRTVLGASLLGHQPVDQVLELVAGQRGEAQVPELGQQRRPEGLLVAS